MRVQRAASVCLLAAMSAAAGFAQMRYHAKIVLEDGTPLPNAPHIRVGMGDRLLPACFIYNVFGNGNVDYTPNWQARTWDPNTADVCPITIFLKGYRTTEAVLRDNATIVLKREGQDHEGSTVSASTLKAPEDARKAYEKGVAALGSNKLGAAQKNFQRAVEIYPDYAQAWTDLGEVLSRQSKNDEAREAFERASKIDPKYVRPYVQLARLALAAGDNAKALDITNHALQMRPVDIPAIYYYHAVASYNLKDFDAAEKSVRQVIQSDTSHDIPRAEHLLGLCLAAKGDRKGALEHMRKYLEISPKAGDAIEVQQEMALIEETAPQPKP